MHLCAFFVFSALCIFIVGVILWGLPDSSENGRFGVGAYPALGPADAVPHAGQARGRAPTPLNDPTIGSAGALITPAHRVVFGKILKMPNFFQVMA